MKTLIVSLKLFLFFTLLTGVLYPLFILITAQVLFPFRANGSLIIKDGQVIGSELIGQSFDSIIYFASRPSVTDYNPLPSGGSNLGLTNSKLKQLIVERGKHFILFNQTDSISTIPAEMVFASASGLDPHISKRAALMQLDRISKARNFNDNQKQKLIECVNDLTNKPQFLIFGEERINVLLLNIAVDKIK